MSILNKLIKTLFVILPLFIFYNVYAECTYKDQAELGGKAAKVKTKYDIEEITVNSICSGEPCTFPGYKMNISLLNLPEDIYAKVTNNVDNQELTLTSSNKDENGIINFEWNNVDKVTTFTIELYANSNTNCSEQKIQSLYLITPRYNWYSSFEWCDGLEDYYLCEDFVTFEDVEYDDFFQKVTKQKEKNEKEKPINNESTFFDKLKSFISNNKGIIIGVGCGAIVIVAVIIVISIRKRRSI